MKGKPFDKFRVTTAMKQLFRQVQKAEMERLK